MINLLGKGDAAVFLHSPSLALGLAALGSRHLGRVVAVLVLNTCNLPTP